MSDAQQATLLAEQRRAFVAKFGREPRPGDPVFFDPDAGTPVPLSQHQMIRVLRAAARRFGSDPDAVVAQYFGPEALATYRRQQ